MKTDPQNYLPTKLFPLKMAQIMHPQNWYGQSKIA